LFEGDNPMMTNFDQGALTNSLFSGSESIGTLEVRARSVFSGLRRLQIDAIAAPGPLLVACLLLFWVLFEWHS
jgi:hypothetical protein